MMQHLEAHFDERTATDLCSKLTSMTQLLEESPYSFVMRCTETKQKVILASMKSDIKYKNLVCKLFYKTLEKVISSWYVAQEIKEGLSHSISDEDLIAAVTKASASDKERIAVQSKARKKVFEVSAETDQMKKLLSAVEDLSKQVSSLQSELNDVKQGGFRNRVTYRCTSAFVHNDVDKYDHCFKCGGTGHQGRYCKKSKGGQQGN